MNHTILDEGFDQDIKLIPASKSKRFIHYFIDSIVFGVLSIFILYLVMPSGESMFEEEFIVGPFVDNLILALLSVMLYMISESLLKGKTVGKYLTKSRVLTDEGMVPDALTIIKRSLCRLIPFDALSFLGSDAYGWHDSISKTIVIDEVKSEFFDSEIY